MQFPTTSWTLVLSAAKEQEASSRQALLRFCEHYWYPLYAFLRRTGYSSDQAEDLVQGFFLKLLEKRYLDSADQNRGRFRSFLLASLQHYVANQHDHDRALKRGGAFRLISLDIPAGEARFASEAYAVADDATPERLYERAWATTLIDRAIETLEAEWAGAGKGGQFATLKPYLSGSGEMSYSEVAGRLGISEGNVKVTVHRLRKRLGQLLREEISITVEHPSQLEDELRFLLAALSHG